MTLTLEWIDERENGGGEGESGWPALLGKLLNVAGELEGVEDGVVTLTLTDNEGIRELNREYRGLDKPTDVLSFPLRGGPGDDADIRYDDDFETLEEELPEDAESDPFAELLGDIVISVPRALEQAQDYGHSADREMGFLFVHGFLHLIGYDHETDEQEKAMFAKQEEILSKAGLSR